MIDIQQTSTPQRDEKIVEEYTKRRKNQILVAIMLTPAIIFFVFAQRGHNISLFGLSSGVLYVISLLLVVGGLFYSYKNWRCPACNTYLRKEWNPAFCPKCGVPLK